MIKVVYIIQSLGNSGGTERVLCSKTNFLANLSEYDVTIITQYPLPKDNFFKFSQSIRIKSLNLPLPPKNKLKKIFEAYLYKRKYKNKLTTMLNKIKPDITVSMYGAEYKFLYDLQDGSKKIVEFHYSRNYLLHLINAIPNLKYRFFHLIRAHWEQYLQEKYAHKYDQVILLTEKDKNLWNNKLDIDVIPNPLSFFSKNKADLKAKQIVAIGRFIAQKGFDRLIKIFSIVNKQYPDWTLLIVGEGQDEEYLNSIITKHDLQKNIFIKPPVQNIRDILLNSSILAFSSRYEGFGLVITEAMECGLPCVAFDCECGPSEIITHNEDGFLIHDGDIDKFAHKLITLIYNDKLRKKMGLKAQENVKRFYPKMIMEKWNSLFHKLTD